MSSLSKRVLLVSRAPEHAREALAARGFAVDAATTENHARDLLRGAPFDAVVLVLPLESGACGRLISELGRYNANAASIVVGRDEQVRGANDALALGAGEYLEALGSEARELLFIIGVALGLREGDAQLAYLRGREVEESEAFGLFGKSPVIARLRATVDRVCALASQSSAPVILLTGETGTGKGVLAKVLHYRGARRNHTFVSVNCAALPDNLVEGELFGHERGAFTSAQSAREGLFETANKGSLFLDEIGSMPLALQPKLLTAIEERVVRRVGGRSARPVDVQIIAATNRSLQTLVERGDFRDDLFYRLNVVSLSLPALRERGDDAVLLARHFIHLTCKEYGLPEPVLTPQAVDWIRRYPWPGNVRELKNRVEAAVLLREGGSLSAEQFGEPVKAGRAAIDAAVNEPIVRLPAQGFSFEQLEREVLRLALAQCAHNISRAARFTGLSRQTFIYRMKKFGLRGD